MKMFADMPRLSRPVRRKNPNAPFEHRDGRRRIERLRRIAIKEVHIGNHRPTDHFAPAAGTFVAAQDLYDNRKRR